MVNFNGNLLSKNTFYLNHENRGLRYGDALFESIRVVNGKIFFWEDHYLRLMASMGNSHEFYHGIFGRTAIGSRKGEWTIGTIGKG